MANLTDRYAEVYGDRSVYVLDPPLTTVYFEGSAISYRQLNKLVCRAANVLRELGVRRGDRVALCTLNRIEIVFAELGAQRIGAVPVPINGMLPADEIRRLVQFSGATMFIGDRSVLEHSVKSRRNLPTVDRWLILGEEVPVGFASLDRLMAESSEESDPELMAPEDPAIIFFTAGTTGLPKGAVLTHGGLVHSFRRYMVLAALVPTSRAQLALLTMPLAHTGGHQSLLIHMALATPSLLMGTFDPARVLDHIERYRVTMFAGTPMMYRMLLDAGAAGRDLTSMWIWGGGGDVFPADLMTTFRDLSARRRGPITVKAAFITGYGLAETAGQVSITPPFTPRSNCVGWFLPGVRWKLAHDDGTPVRGRQVGEVWLKTRGCMRAYWDDEEGTNQAMVDGWLRTGDLMRRGRFGLLYFVARKEDMIKVGGHSVFPAEVERSLMEHPEVSRCVVVGMPHKYKGELPAAAVVLERGASVTEDEFLAWIARHIVPYRRPRRVVFLDEIPRSSGMKPLREHVTKLLLSDGVEVESRSDRPRSKAGSPPCAQPYLP